MSAGIQYTKILQEISNLAVQYGRDPKEISLVAVSKGCISEDILLPYHSGCRDFGENRVVDLLSKMPTLPSDIRWHMIGTLQTNKVKKVIGKCALIHSVDNLHLAQTISDNSTAVGVITPVLLQVNTSGEPTKHGVSPQEWKKHFESAYRLPGIRIEGLMTIAPLITDEKQIRHCFAKLRFLRDELAVESLHHLSMGMSHDYPLAIAEGATILRIGSSIFHPNRQG